MIWDFVIGLFFVHLAGFYKISVGSQTRGNHTGKLGGSKIHDEDLKEELISTEVVPPGVV